MYIEPNTVIRVLRGCPLDSTYTHTIYFNSVTEQANYFIGLTKWVLTKQSYQRVKRGYMRIAYKAEDLYDCNYIMFRNDSFGDKWFYAFIKSVEYVNNVTCEVEYEIDVLQTWFFECKPGPSFIEREHSLTDEPGDNLVKEELYFGDYVYSFGGGFVDTYGQTLIDLSLVIVYNPSILDLTQNETLAQFVYREGVYSGVYQGVQFFAIPNVQENEAILGEIFELIDLTSFGGLICSFMYPTMLLPNKNGDNEYNKQVTGFAGRPDKIGTYTPDNKKLLTYPYTCAYLTSYRGVGNEFHWEYFDKESAPTFIVEGLFSTNASIMAYPINYKGLSNYLEGAVSINSYPMCAWGADGFTEWVNNNLFKSMIGDYRGIAHSTIGGATSGGGKGALIGLGRGAANAIVDQIGRPAEALFDSGTVHGGVTGDILIGNKSGRLISIATKHIREEYAKIIDEYFSMYGYKTNRVKEPNRNTRPHWNYVKTVGCSLVGSENGPTSIPSSDAHKICEIYDTGITFWAHGNEVGDYTLDNTVSTVNNGGGENNE